VPGGRDPSGLPVGLQLVGRAFDEATLLRLAANYERDAPCWQEAPPTPALASGIPAPTR